MKKRFVAIPTTKLINECERGVLPSIDSISRMSISEQNNLPQNKISIEEIENLQLPIDLVIEHDRSRTVGYIDTIWCGIDGTPYVLATVTDDLTYEKIKAGHYRGLSVYGVRAVRYDGTVGQIRIEEISLTEDPFFDECRIIQCCSKNKPADNHKNTELVTNRKKKILSFKFIKNMNEVIKRPVQKMDNKPDDQQKQKSNSDETDQSESYKITKREYEELMSLKKEQELYKKKYEEEGKSEYEKKWGKYNKIIADNPLGTIISNMYTKPIASEMKTCLEKVISTIEEESVSRKNKRLRDPIDYDNNERAFKKTSQPTILTVASRTGDSYKNVKMELYDVLVQGTPLEKLSRFG